MSLSTNVTLTVSDYDIKLSRNLKFYENDQLKLIFTLNYWGIDNAKGSSQRVLMPLNALTAILFIETPLGVDTVESATIEENVVTFYLTSNQTQYIGISRMQIQLLDEDGCQITLPPMNFEVRENIYGNEVMLSKVLLSDENENIIVDENGNAINTGTKVSAQTYAVALSEENGSETTTSQPTKQIKDFNLKTGASGEEDLLIQDSDGATKRIKASEFLNVNVDLTLYCTKEEVNTLLNNKANISHTHTVADIEDMPDYALKTDIPTVPTKTSELTNDTGFITTIPTEYITESELNTELSTKANISDIPSLDGYATETFVTNKIAEASLSGGEVDLSEYATKDELNTKANISHTHTVSEITNLVIPTVDVDKNYVDTQLATKANIEDIPNLDGYALKSEIPTVPTKTSELVNDSGFITTIPTEYVTENELNAKGYLTEHQDISMKADKTELHTHDNKTVLDGITSTKVTEWNNKSNFDGNYNSLTNKPTIPTVDVDKNYVDTQLSTKANITDIPSLDGYATETFVTNKIAEASLGGGGEVDLSGYATKDELNSSLATKSDTTHNHDTVYAPIEHEHSQYLTSVPSEYVTDEELNAKGYLTSHQDISGKADKLYVDTELAKKSDKTHTHSYNNLTDKPTIPTVDVNKNYVDTQLATKANTSDIPSLNGYATETFVTNKIAEAQLGGSGSGNIIFSNVENGEIFTVVEKIIGSIVVNETTFSVNEGKSFTFDVSLDKAPDENQIVTISSVSNLLSFNKASLTFTADNYNIVQTVTVTTNNDDVYNGNTSATIVLSSENLTKNINVTIVEDEEQPAIAVQSISISSTSNTINTNGSITLNAVLTPSNATNKEVTWSKDNDNISLVPSGLSCVVRGEKVGTSIITVTSNDTTNGTISSEFSVTIEESTIEEPDPSPTNVMPLSIHTTDDGVEYLQINDYTDFRNGKNPFVVSDSPNSYKNDVWEMHAVLLNSLWISLSMSPDVFLDQFEVFNGTASSCLSYSAKTDKDVLCYTGSALMLRVPLGSNIKDYLFSKFDNFKIKMPETYKTFNIDAEKLTNMTVKTSNVEGAQYAHFNYSELPSSNIYSGVNTFCVRTSTNANQTGTIPPGVAISTSVVSITFKPNTFTDFTLDAVKEYIRNNPIVLYY